MDFVDWVIIMFILYLTWGEISEINGKIDKIKSELKTLDSIVSEQITINSNK
jgi:hypothetical protein